MKNSKETDSSSPRDIAMNIFNTLKNMVSSSVGDVIAKRHSPSDDEERGAMTGFVFVAFISGLIFALCFSLILETLVMSSSLDARFLLAEKTASRSPSFANANLDKGFSGMTEMNPFASESPESEEKSESKYPVSSLMLAGTLPNVAAWIRDDAGTHLVLKGQELKGYKLESIAYGSALVSSGGETYPLHLNLSGGESVPPPPPPSLPAASKKHDADYSSIVAAGDGKEGSVPRGLVDKLLMNPYDEIAKMRMTPAEGGGMKLERIAADSVLGLVGVSQGDVVKAINGINISNLGDVANAVNSLMSGSRFDVTVDRGGKPLDLKYQVK